MTAANRQSSGVVTTVEVGFQGPPPIGPLSAAAGVEMARTVISVSALIMKWVMGKLLLERAMKVEERHLIIT